MNTTDTTTTRPLAERIPQAAMHAFQLSDYLIIGEAPPAAGAHIARRVTRPDMADSAALIVEAFNVTHKTGRTPRQLADERAELIAALNWVLAGTAWSAIAPEALDHATELLNRLNP